MLLQFSKMNGAGNDFVLVDNRTGEIDLTAPQIASLCDRHRGVGGDGLLAVEPAQNGADFRMRYYNADGGEAEMCGNGARCFARFAQRLAGTSGVVKFETMAGVISAEMIGTQVRLAMGAPRDLVLGTELEVEEIPWTIHSVNTGVPHAVVPVQDLHALDVVKLGSELRWHEHFEPKGTNVNFLHATGEQEIAIRTYERGVEDETLACGTGVVASALVYHYLTGALPPIAVRVEGGDTLQVAWQGAREGIHNVTLTGPAEFVFEGAVEV